MMNFSIKTGLLRPLTCVQLSMDSKGRQNQASLIAMHSEFKTRITSKFKRIRGFQAFSVQHSLFAC